MICIDKTELLTERDVERFYDGLEELLVAALDLADFE